MLIGASTAHLENGKQVDVLNPASGELIDTVTSATPAHIELTLDCAKKGRDLWAETPLHERCKILFKYADLVEANQDELALLLSKETGKAIKSAEGEMSRVGMMVRGYAERALHLYGDCLSDAQPGMEKDVIFTRRDPLGIVVCVVPFNHPASLYTQKIAPALAMGNAIIIKPASDNPLTVLRLTQLLLDAGVPPTVAQCITGSGSVIGNYLVSSPHINAITLTGSTGVGIAVAEQAAKHLHHVHLELGGNDPFIVFGDADVDVAVEDTVISRAFTAGQTCASSKRLIIHNSIKQTYTEKLVARLKEIKVGDPQSRDTDVGTLINEGAAAEVEKQVQHTIDQGAKCILGGKRDGAFFPMTVLTDVTPEMDVSKDLEIFGPVFPVIGFDTPEEAIEIANSSCFGLMSGIMTNDYKTAMKMAKALQSGGVVVGGTGNYRPPELAFGGYKMSGIGREGISATLEEMSQLKSIILKGVF
ncbi:aldehyde dehydrogenase family protein [Alteromonas lipolytica]|uniref:Succinate-semialdehyde dehydrogenase n=1 Tax=Alteromonas lipolytica TaxID=1856405 RepID=A0A1E8F8Z5_9ALTE|nr:aldehyde dehydrogenase family protein [Alteromonas lipolytica]OFI32387.1 succinate-semialdehyde dehydrogenase [Alteromonas lipolytica]